MLSPPQAMFPLRICRVPSVQIVKFLFKDSDLYFEVEQDSVVDVFETAMHGEIVVTANESRELWKPFWVLVHYTETYQRLSCSALGSGKVHLPVSLLNLSWPSS